MSKKSMNKRVAGRASRRVKGQEYRGRMAMDKTRLIAKNMEINGYPDE